MKKAIAALILVALVMGLTAGALAYGGYVTFTGDCHVRRGPGLDYSSMGTVSSGITLDYEGDTSYDDRGVAWYSVYFNGSLGWVSSKYAVLHNDYDYDDDYDDYDYDDLYVPLVIKDGSRGEWKNYDNNKIGMRITVTNVSSYQTIKAFEIYMYATDVWGDRIYGDTTVYYGTTTCSLGPGQSMFSDYINMPDRNRIDKIYAGVKKVIFTDGTIHENSSVDFSNWSIY